jgi:HEAT repeat protein
VISTLATALAKQANILPSLITGLKTNYQTAQSATYALALGFMPGFAVEPLKQALQDKNTNVRINAARATAYMAGVLISPDASRYSTDKTFDTQLIKTLIPLLSAMARNETAQAKPYAENALKQIAKLK